MSEGAQLQAKFTVFTSAMSSNEIKEADSRGEHPETARHVKVKCIVLKYLKKHDNGITIKRGRI